jgi:DNA-binding PadR family transcriptional regulator
MSELGPKASASKASPLEMAVLGIVWKKEPCTAYTVMRELSNSASAFIRSKAGSVYPLVARLLLAELLVYEEGEPGSKGNRNLRITNAGLAKLRSWLCSPIPFEDISHTVDLVRMRSGYLGTLEPAEREQFVERSLAGLRDHLRSCEARQMHYLQVGDAFGAMGVREMLHETRARIAWLEQERPTIMTLPAGKPSRPSK